MNKKELKNDVFSEYSFRNKIRLSVFPLKNKTPFFFFCLFENDFSTFPTERKVFEPSSDHYHRH